MRKVQRRVAAGVLIAFGVVLMLAAPDTWSGLLLVAVAVVLEIVGLALERRR